MTVNRTTLLDLPLPVTGTESGTWGDTTNNGLTQYVDIAIAGMSNLTSANFTAGALTIETTEGDSSATNISATSAQYAGFRVTSLAANSTITVGNTGTSPARSYRLINADATYSLTFKATGQTGVTLLPGQSALVAFNGTDYVIVGTVGAGSTTDNTVPRFDGTTGKILQSSGITIDDSNNVSGVAQLNITTLDATNIEVTNIKAKDGTAAASIADSTGVISVTANPILSGGTANGVLYLNGSKVATSGSALTFDGTTFTHTGASNFATSTGSVGVGTASPNGKLQVAGTFASQNNIVSITSSGVGSAATGAVRALYVNAQTANTASSVYGVFSEVTYTNSQTNYGGYFSAGDPTGDSYGVYGLAAQTDVNGPGTAYGGYFKATAGATGNSGITYGARIENAGAVGNSAYGLTVSTVAGASTVVPFQVLHAGSEALRVDSSRNLGIGTSSPGTKLEVSRGTTANASATGSTTRSNSALALAASSDTNTRVMFGIDTNTNGWVQVQNTSSNGTADLIINPVGGNLGLGVTPSAWNSAFKTIQIGQGAFGSQNNAQVAHMWSNAFSDGVSYKYIASAPATHYRQYNGAHEWYTASSGTAGNAITFTQAMTLDASGNLGVGTTSPQDRLDVVSGSSSFRNRIRNSTGAESFLLFQNSDTGTGTNDGLIVGIAGDESAYVLNHENQPIIFGTDNLERARITSGGDVVVTGVGGLGYGTGSGGAVTQATSRTTGVTLDKTNGAITLVSAAGTTTWQTFTVTNNKVAATDTVIVNQKSGTDLYQIFVTNVAAGSFKISFATTGGTTTEQPVFNFAVIKAVTA